MEKLIVQKLPIWVIVKPNGTLVRDCFLKDYPVLVVTSLAAAKDIIETHKRNMSEDLGEAFYVGDCPNWVITNPE